jgi:hypothetical protein
MYKIDKSMNGNSVLMKTSFRYFKGEFVECVDNLNRMDENG